MQVVEIFFNSNDLSSFGNLNISVILTLTLEDTPDGLLVVDIDVGVEGAPLPPRLVFGGRGLAHARVCLHGERVGERDACKKKWKLFRN